MKQSTCHEQPSGLHVAIIMDGNGRWAEQRDRPRPFGHAQGERAVRRIVESAPPLGISTLTLFAFSSDNWKRPAVEVSNLLGLFEHFLGTEIANCNRNGIRLTVIGRRDRFSHSLRLAVQGAEQATRNGRRLDLRIAFDYSSRDAICQAARTYTGDAPPVREEFECILNRVIHSRPSTPPVDLLIRTGGEQRLSDFLLWESAYAELIFTDVLWPDFSTGNLIEALRTFATRNRRYGDLPARREGNQQGPRNPARAARPSGGGTKQDPPPPTTGWGDQQNHLTAQVGSPETNLHQPDPF